MTQTVLLAEREAHVRHMLAFKLRTGGFDVLLAEDGEDAFELARTHCPAVLVIDQQLGRGDGTPLHLALAAEPAIATVPLVLLTALENEASPALPAGVRLTREVCKPVGPSELLRVVQEILCPTSAQNVAQSIAFKRFAI